MKTIHNLIVLVFLVSVFWSCEDIIYPELEQVDPQIAIDAWITNTPGPQYIRITETHPYFDAVPLLGIDNATVYIIDYESNLKYDFTEKASGIYEWIPTAEFPQIGTVGNTYYLSIEIEGNEYVSSSILNRVPKIDSVVFSYEEESIYPEGYYAQFFANDIIGPGDTYWIKAYKNGNFLNKPFEINIAFDAGFTAGGNVDGTTFVRLIRDAINPYDTDEAGDYLPSYEPGDSVYVEVHSISNEAFNYLNQMKLQIDRPGGFAEIFAVPLANVPSNILNSDSEGQQPIGFFNMSAVSWGSQWLDPNNLPD